MNISVLPPEVQTGFLRLSENARQEAMELRFRRDRPVTVVYACGERVLPGNIPVTDRLVEELLNRATGFSPYSLRLEETGLFLPLPEGCRMGLCGEVTVRDGNIHGIRRLSSVSIRFARQIIGIAEETVDRLMEGEHLASVLIVSPPGGGKTTFLRDLIRAISARGYRVAVVDERRELGAVTEGVPGLDLGPTTDILTGCPKVQAIPLLIRAMNPQVLALDELSGERELEEALYASYSGIALLATAHGDGLESLKKRPLYRKLLESGAFRWCVELRSGEKPKMKEVISS